MPKLKAAFVGADEKQVTTLYTDLTEELYDGDGQQLNPRQWHIKGSFSTFDITAVRLKLDDGKVIGADGQEVKAAGDDGNGFDDNLGADDGATPSYDMMVIVLDASKDAKDLKTQAADIKKLNLPTPKQTHIIYLHDAESKETKEKTKERALELLPTIYNSPVDAKAHPLNVYRTTKPRTQEYNANHMGFWINFKAKNNNYHQNLPAIVAAFKKIYNALYDGQSSWFKSTNFVKQHFEVEHNNSGNDAENQQNTIRAYIQQNPNSRTAYAWRLACDHFDNLNPNENRRLFNKIYQYAFANTGWFFKQSKSLGATLFATSTVKAKLNENMPIPGSLDDNTRAGKIFNALRKQ